MKTNVPPWDVEMSTRKTETLCTQLRNDSLTAEPGILDRPEHTAEDSVRSAHIVMCSLGGSVARTLRRILLSTLVLAMLESTGCGPGPKSGNLKQPSTPPTTQDVRDPNQPTKEEPVLNKWIEKIFTFNGDINYQKR